MDVFQQNTPDLFEFHAITMEDLMGDTKRNRNALRSQRLLKEAFSQLLAEKPYEKITVADVTRRADLNRGTFYAHFDSIDDLALKLVDGIMEKLFVVVNAASEECFLQDPKPVIDLVGTYLSQEQSLYRTLLATKQVDLFLASMKREIARRVASQVGDLYPEGMSLAVQMNVTYVTAGLVDVYRAWLQGEYGEATVDEIGEIAVKLVQSGSFSELVP